MTKQPLTRESWPFHPSSPQTLSSNTLLTHCLNTLRSGGTRIILPSLPFQIRSTGISQPSWIDRQFRMRKLLAGRLTGNNNSFSILPCQLAWCEALKSSAQFLSLVTLTWIQPSSPGAKLYLSCTSAGNDGQNPKLDATNTLQLI